MAQLMSSPSEGHSSGLKRNPDVFLTWPIPGEVDWISFNGLLANL